MSRQRSLVALVLLLVGAGHTRLSAEIQRSPVGVNVNSQGATSVLITFGGLAQQVPVEALWCGALVSAAPDLGQRCDPATIFGRLPLRFEQSSLSANGAVFTDVMTIPATVSRRAYQAAQRGEDPSFFYVRRFSSLVGERDEFVAVTCRLSGGGARSPLALLEVELSFASGETVASVAQGERPPRVVGRLRYNGAGTLRGRWEVVQPGDETPTNRDLLSEAALPAAERSTQRRYTEVGRISQYLLPTGEAEIPGPDPARLPTASEGLYVLLLRIEASQEREGDSDLAEAGAGSGVLASGGVAGFALPTLRYLVASGILPPGELALLAPPEGTKLDGAALELAWQTTKKALLYRVEFAAADHRPVFSALLQQGIGRYTAPSWLTERFGTSLQVRVVALGPEDSEIATTPWRLLEWGQRP